MQEIVATDKELPKNVVDGMDYQQNKSMGQRPKVPAIALESVVADNNPRLYGIVKRRFRSRQ